MQQKRYILFNMSYHIKNKFSYNRVFCLLTAGYLVFTTPVIASDVIDNPDAGKSSPSGTMLLPLSPKLDMQASTPSPNIDKNSVVPATTSGNNKEQSSPALQTVSAEKGAVSTDSLGSGNDSMDEKATLKGTIQIVADDTEFDQDKNTFLGTGNAVALIGGQNSKLQADSILYDQNNQMIEARGNVSIMRGGQLTTGSSFKFNVTSDEYLITQPETMVDATQVIARKSVGTKTGLAFKEGTMSVPVPFFLAKNIASGPMSYREDIMAQKSHPDAYLPEHASFKFKAQKMVYERFKEQGNFTIFGGRIEVGEFSIPVGKLVCTVGKTETKAVIPITPYIGNNMYSGGINIGPAFNTGIGKSSMLTWSPMVQFGGTAAGGTTGTPASGSSVGLAGRVAFNSPNFQTHLAYGSVSNLLVGDIKARVWRSVRLQAGVNRWLTDGILGMTRARIALELVNTKNIYSIPYLSVLAFRTTGGWYQDDPQLVNISSTYAQLHGSPTSTIMKSAYKLQQQVMFTTHPFFNIGNDKWGIKSFIYGGAAARGYSTNNADFITQLSPILDVHLSRVRLQTGYTTSTVNGQSPFVFDEYIQGSSSSFIQGDVKLCKYLSVGGMYGYNMSQKLAYAKQVVAAIGPPDVKFVVGKDFIMNNYRFGFNLLYGDPIQFNKLVFKGNPDQGQLGTSAGGI